MSAGDIGPAGEARRPDPQRLIASFPLAVLLLAPDLTIAGVNPAAEQLLGRGARRLLGRPLGAVLAFEEPRIAGCLGEGDAHLFARDSTVGILGQRPCQLDVSIAPVTHSPGWQLLTLHQPIGVEALARDGAGAGCGEAAPLRAPEVLAHEIKNPLAAIRGAAQLLGRSVPAAGQPLVELITSEVDRIAGLIDQMQSLSRRSAEPARACNLHEAVRRAKAVLEASAQGGLRIEEEFDPSLPLVLCGADALVQVVLNLLTNAYEACAPAKRPRIIVRTRFASGIFLHGARGEAPLKLPIELRVSDNGPGIRTDLRDHIFDPFVTGKPHGQGLGLALVQKLVREMSGRITHDRDEAAGLTHFRLHLPVAEEARHGARAAA
jgi:two-component system nitrogen regulation sensor histidine kinase GlnL